MDGCSRLNFRETNCNQWQKRNWVQRLKSLWTAQNRVTTVGEIFENITTSTFDFWQINCSETLHCWQLHLYNSEIFIRWKFKKDIVWSQVAFSSYVGTRWLRTDQLSMCNCSSYVFYSIIRYFGEGMNEQITGEQIVWCSSTEMSRLSNKTWLHSGMF